MCIRDRDDIFRLVIPVPESYVKYIRIGDPVQVRVTSLDKVVTGTVKRFSADVAAETRTMHTEVEVLNPSHVLLPGLYAEATLTLEHKDAALSLPLQAVTQANGKATVFLVDANNTLQELSLIHISRMRLTLGLKKAFPWLTARTASTTSDSAELLSTYPRAPTLRALSR